MSQPMVFAVAHCPICGARTPKAFPFCTRCTEEWAKEGRLVRVRADAPRFAGRIGWVMSIRGEDVNIKTNLNGTLWFRTKLPHIEPVIAKGES